MNQSDKISKANSADDVLQSKKAEAGKSDVVRNGFYPSTEGASRPPLYGFPVAPSENSGGNGPHAKFSTSTRSLARLSYSVCLSPPAASESDPSNLQASGPVKITDYFDEMGQVRRVFLN